MPLTIAPLPGWMWASCGQGPYPIEWVQYLKMLCISVAFSLPSASHRAKINRYGVHTLMNDEIDKGKLLIAMPTLQDPNFRQSVVLLCEHGPQGSLGLVVNRPTDVDVSTFADELPELADAGRVYTGGPVGRNAMLILCRGNDFAEGMGILQNVFLAKNLETLKLQGLLGPEGKIRCYLGYAGWAPGQLEAEVNAGAWHLMPADDRLIFDANPNILWQEMMTRLGGEWAIYASMPSDPGLN